MAKFVVTSGSYFEPFSYDEVVRPLQQMADAQNAAADTYDQLGMETEALRRYISENEGDTEARALYDNYVNKLNTLQDNLWKNGYNATTRRDLAAARSAYASDISRIGAAVKARQERSKEYWDAKHKNPDLVMGYDPGQSGLDNYLHDDMYGSNWYSYSGTDFTNEVGTDAKARANELLSDYQNRVDIQKDPRTVGYLTRIVKNGFTSQEVDNASAAARLAIQSGDRSGIEKLPIAEGILANVLLSHLDSTGAQGNVSDSEFNRLFEYGRQGLSHAVGKTDIDTLNDKVWDFNKQLALQGSKSSGSGSNKQASQSKPYTLDDISAFLKGANSSNMTGDIEKHFIEPFKSPIMVTNSDGTIGTINNPDDASNTLAGLGRKDIIDTFNIDPEDIETGVVELPNGNKVRIRAIERGDRNYSEPFDPDAGYYSYVLESQDSNGRWIKDNALTDRFTQMYDRYKANYAEWKQNNPNVDLNKLVISDAEKKKMLKTGKIDGDINVNDIPYVLATKAKVGRVTPATIAGPREDMESTRKNYALSIVDAFADAPKDRKGRIPKDQSEYGFYPVDGYNIGDKPERDINKVFGTKKVGTNVVTNTDTVSSIGVLPEDVLANKVRITVNGKTWAVNPAMLGNNMDNQISILKEPVSEMMLPIFEPERALRMTQDEERDWIADVSNLLGGYMDLVGFDEYGNVTTVVRPQDIVRSEGLQGALRNAVTSFMNNVIAEARDEMNHNNMQVRSNTGNANYNDYLNAQ